MENLRKLTRDPDAVYSDRALIRAMYSQFKIWTHPDAKSTYSYHIMLLHYRDTFNHECINLMNYIYGLDYRVMDSIKERQTLKGICLRQLDIGEDEIKMSKEIDDFESDCGEKILAELSYLPKRGKKRGEISLTMPGINTFVSSDMTAQQQMILHRTQINKKNNEIIKASIKKKMTDLEKEKEKKRNSKL